MFSTRPGTLLASSRDLTVIYIKKKSSCLNAGKRHERIRWLQFLLWPHEGSGEQPWHRLAPLCEGTCCGPRWPGWDFRGFPAPEQVGSGQGAEGGALAMYSALTVTVTSVPSAHALHSLGEGLAGQRGKRRGPGM